MTSLAPDSRVHVRRLRDVYRSAGWPFQDTVELELLAAGLLERRLAPGGHEQVRLTDAGVAFLAQALGRRKRAEGAHDQLVARMARVLQRDGRLVWSGLSLRARLPGDPDTPDRPRWRLCQPDLFSVRHTSVAAYLQPVVHEIKVSRADLLGDLHAVDKRASYLDLAGQCWYVLGCDRRGRPIAQADEIPPECGVIVAWPDERIEVQRMAPQRAVAELPFPLWMALARATPLTPAHAQALDDAPEQAWLQATG